MATDRIKVSVRDDEIAKGRIERQESLNLRWKKNWSWMTPEYVQLQKDLAAISDTRKTCDSIFEDNRNLKPFPETTFQMIGWLSSKKEFQLEVYGEDVFKPPMLELPK